MELFTLYWIATTIYGAYYLAKNPPVGELYPDKHFTLLDVIAKIIPAAILAWVFIPLFLLSKIKFKRS